jgi:beta-glucanase (GH16 family)
MMPQAATPLWADDKFGGRALGGGVAVPYAKRMRYALLVTTLLSTACASCGGGSSSGGNNTPAPRPTPTPTTAPTATPSGPYALFWSDEFDGAAGTPVNAATWSFETGGGGWGNNELQTYTDRTINTSLDGTGALAIKAFREEYTGTDNITRSYTSGRIRTLGKFETLHGRFEARIKVPRGRGLWPAFWMMGNDITAVNWPQCGEIDIMEHIGVNPFTVYATLHGPGYSGAAGIGAPLTLPNAIADNFHVFSVEWDPNLIRWYMNGQLYHTVTPASVGANQWVFEHPFFMLLNLAVGGSWPGPPDASTMFPATYQIDYIRIHKRSNG